jgi:hypothetical protein
MKKPLKYEVPSLMSKLRRLQSSNKKKYVRTTLKKTKKNLLCVKYLPVPRVWSPKQFLKKKKKKGKC